jgi:hypothetical protein
MSQRSSVAVLLLVGVLAFAPAARGAADPVSSGSFNLKLSGAFKDQLRHNGVAMKPKAFTLKEGEVDPVNGTGEVTLKGKLRFKHGQRTVAYKNVTAKLGDGGVLKGNGTKLFRLRGGSVTRDGFGAEITGVKATLLRSAARKLNRKLRLDSLHSGSAGALSVSAQPQTVEVTGGVVQVVPDPDLSSLGNVAGKLNAHCIQFSSGNTAIAPGTKGGTTSNPFYDFPVTGGTISPLGTDGAFQLAGGIQVLNRKTGGGVPAECNSPTPVALATLQQTDLALNLLQDYVSTHVVVNGSVPTQGDNGVRIGSNLDTSRATVIADPSNHTVSIQGIVVTINSATALVLNQTFLQPSFNASMEFANGDLFGTLDLTVTTR